MWFFMFKGICFVYSWLGYLCLVRNDVLVMCEFEIGFYVVCVDNGFGMMCSMLIGIGVVELVCGLISLIIEFFGV